MDILKNLLVVVVILVVVAAATAIGKETGRGAVKQYAASDVNRSDVTVEDALRQTANLMNRSLPMMVNKRTRLDNAAPGPGKRLTYYYTLVSYSSVDVTIQELKDAMWPTLRTSVCTDPQSHFLLQQGVQLVYHYKGSDGGYIGDFALNPSDCP